MSLSRLEFSNFLIAIQNRAFKFASYELSNEEDALDAVQETMIKLSEKYDQRPLEELTPLFWSILRNKITDKRRKNSINNLREILFSVLVGSNEEDENPEEAVLSSTPSSSKGQEYEAGKRSVLTVIEEELRRLPTRQREAFLLRHVEGLDLAGSAKAMGCTEGSVKTHTHRACQALMTALNQRGIQSDALDLE